MLICEHNVAVKNTQLGIRRPDCIRTPQVNRCNLYLSAKWSYFFVGLIGDYVGVNLIVCKTLHRASKCQLFYMVLLK